MAHVHFAGAIWTNHALDRLVERKLSQEMAGEAFANPDKMTHGKQAGTTEFYKRFGNSHVTVIGKPNEKKEWIILSAWIDPPLPGTKDYKQKENYKKYKKAGFWGKLWISLRKQMGI